MRPSLPAAASLPESDLFPPDATIERKTSLPKGKDGDSFNDFLLQKFFLWQKDNATKKKGKDAPRMSEFYSTMSKELHDAYVYFFHAIVCILSPE